MMIIDNHQYAVFFTFLPLDLDNPRGVEPGMWTEKPHGSLAPWPQQGESLGCAGSPSPGGTSYLMWATEENPASSI